MLGAFYYWLPKITGRMLSERLGRWNFWVMFVGFNVGFFPMHIAGLLGMPRRIYTYPSGMGWDASNLISTLGAYLFAVGVLLFIVNFFWSLRNGETAGNNPWDAASLEWSVSSPPPQYNFAVIPTVRSRDPLWEDRLGIPARSSLDTGPVLDVGRETTSTRPLDANDVRVLHMPEDSLWPLIVALALLVLFYGLLLRGWWIALAGAIVLFIAISGWLWPTDVTAEQEALS